MGKSDYASVDQDTSVTLVVDDIGTMPFVEEIKKSFEPDIVWSLPMWEKTVPVTPPRQEIFTSKANGLETVALADTLTEQNKLAKQFEDKWNRQSHLQFLNYMINVTGNVGDTIPIRMHGYTREEIDGAHLTRGRWYSGDTLLLFKKLTLNNYNDIYGSVIESGTSSLENECEGDTVSDDDIDHEYVFVNKEVKCGSESLRVLYDNSHYTNLYVQHMYDCVYEDVPLNKGDRCHVFQTTNHQFKITVLDRKWKKVLHTEYIYKGKTGETEETGKQPDEEKNAYVPELYIHREITELLNKLYGYDRLEVRSDGTIPLYYYTANPFDCLDDSVKMDVVPTAVLRRLLAEETTDSLNMFILDLECVMTTKHEEYKHSRRFYEIERHCANALKNSVETVETVGTVETCTPGPVGYMVAQEFYCENVEGEYYRDTSIIRSNCCFRETVHVVDLGAPARERFKVDITDFHVDQSQFTCHVKAKLYNILTFREKLENGNDSRRPMSLMPFLKENRKNQKTRGRFNLVEPDEKYEIVLCQRFFKLSFYRDDSCQYEIYRPQFFQLEDTGKKSKGYHYHATPKVSLTTENFSDNLLYHVVHSELMPLTDGVFDKLVKILIAIVKPSADGSEFPYNVQTSSSRCQLDLILDVDDEDDESYLTTQYSEAVSFYRKRIANEAGFFSWLRRAKITKSTSDGANGSGDASGSKQLSTTVGGKVTFDLTTGDDHKILIKEEKRKILDKYAAIVYKIVGTLDNEHDVIVKLGLFPDSRVARSPHEFKMRTDRAVVLALGRVVVGERKIRYKFDIEEAKSNVYRHCGDFIYRLGEVVVPDSFNGDLTQVCVAGIHFFSSQVEALAYSDRSHKYKVNRSLDEMIDMIFENGAYIRISQLAKTHAEIAASTNPGASTNPDTSTNPSTQMKSAPPSYDAVMGESSTSPVPASETMVLPLHAHVHQWKPATVSPLTIDPPPIYSRKSSRSVSSIYALPSELIVLSSSTSSETDAIDELEQLEVPSGSLSVEEESEKDEAEESEVSSDSLSESEEAPQATSSRKREKMEAWV